MAKKKNNPGHSLQQYPLTWWFHCYETKSALWQHVYVQPLPLQQPKAASPLGTNPQPQQPLQPFLPYTVDGTCKELQKYEIQSTATLLLCLVGADVQVIHLNIFVLHSHRLKHLYHLFSPLFLMNYCFPLILQDQIKAEIFKTMHRIYHL